MSHSAYCSLVLDRPVTQVWDVVRDFNSSPVWVNGVDESHIEHGLSGTAVGGVRNFAMGGACTRQRLVAHSDAERFFTYESCAPFEIEWWATMLPTWLHSLRDHVSAQPRNPFGVQDVPDPDGEDITAFAGGVGLTGSADDDNAHSWDAPGAAGPARLEGNWSSRWNGEGFAWQQGRAKLRVDDERIYILFDWDDASKQGLIEARWDGEDRLVGRYLNLSAPEITRPWLGLIVDATRIDGEHSGGRIDFRR